MSKRTHTNNSKTSFEANLPGPENITRTQLPNGLTILCRANYNSPSVFISGYLPVGAIFDPDEQLGLAGFTASMLMRGTEHRDFTHINNTLESVGATLGLSSGTHLTSFGGMALSEDLDMLLSILAEVLQQPIFPSDQVERLRAQLLTSLSIRDNTTSSMATWKAQPNSQVHLFDLNRLSKKATSRNKRAATPGFVTGAGVVGIFSGAGVRA